MSAQHKTILRQRPSARIANLEFMAGNPWCAFAGQSKSGKIRMLEMFMIIFELIGAVLVADFALNCLQSLSVMRGGSGGWVLLE